jgi:site-specific DNA-methyltransferase (adenine-specific)
MTAPINSDVETTRSRAVVVSDACYASACGRVTLYHGDCREIAPMLKGVDAVISDPPYGMDWNPETTRFSGGNNPGQRLAGRNDRRKVMHDNEPFDPSPWLVWDKVVLFGSNHFGSRLPVGTKLVWIKRNDEAFGSFLSDAEEAWMKGGHGIYCKRDLSMNGETATRCHPTQKPVPLMAWCMDKAKVPAGAVVLDPFMGSGTTGIACIRTGRRFVGIEKDPTHYATALERIKNELAQGDLFLGFTDQSTFPEACAPEQISGINNARPVGAGNPQHNT